MNSFDEFNLAIRKYIGKQKSALKIIGLVNGTSLSFFYEVFCVGKNFDCRSRNTAGVCIPEHITAAGLKLLCVLLRTGIMPGHLWI